MAMDIVRSVEQTIIEERLLRPDDTIVVAVSGGPDSMALLHVLHQLSEAWNLTLIVAHVNHQFRGEESELEARDVQKMAAELGLPFEMAAIDLPAYIRDNSLNAQAAAREKRYEFLHETAERYGASKIALAHHGDDQAETLIMRILRGASPSGLKGISIRRVEKKVELIRPFLRIYKTDLVQYCSQEGLRYSQDSSNSSRKYVRNQIRLDVMPYLMKYNPQLPCALNRLAETMQDEDDFIEQHVRHVFHELVERVAEGFYMRRMDFIELHAALQRRLIKLILGYAAGDDLLLDFTRVELIRRAIANESPTTVKLDVSDQFQLIREYDRFGIIEKHAELREGYQYSIDGTSGQLVLLPSDFKLEYHLLELSGDATLHRNDRWNASFDYDLLRFPLTVRSRSEGDRMEPLGLNGSKKVKDMFIDEKIPPSQREAIPCLADATGRLLWIPGLRRSKHALVSERTNRCFQVSCRRL